MKLVIVESPTKSKTIGHYLGNDYEVLASKGHIKDLATSGKGGLGVDVDNDFKPKYVVNKDKIKIVGELKKKAKNAEEIIIATDPDREGEAIAYSLLTVLDLPIETTKRLEFHEITKDSIKKAIEEPRTIDMNLVYSQEARRIIDRIIGFKLSGLLRNKISSKSAGRVQSVALKLICDHEEEILNFKSEKFYELSGTISYGDKEYELELYEYKDEKLDSFKNESEAKLAYSSLKEDVVVIDKEEKEKYLSAKEPFRTSTLQQQAFSKYGFSTKKTTFLAQELYEGVETSEGLVGLITYIRTDSTRLSDVFVENAKSYIIDKFGENYYKGVSKIRKNVKGAQDAHEAIRPTSLERTPESMKKHLSLDQYRLYKLIFERTLSSLMSDKKVLNVINYLKSGDVTFKLTGNNVLFAGYDVFKLDEEDKKVPELEINSTYKLLKSELKEDETKPPARYSEGRLVKLMEDKGIGRPSTYSSTIQTLIERKYVTSKKGLLTPTEQGMLTSKVLYKYFPDLINTEYTAKMETSLDDISSGEENRTEVIREFYDPFIKHFEEVKEVMYKEPLKKTGEICPECGSDLVERVGRYGKFVCCSNYPNCHYIKKEEKAAPEEIGRNCPNCGSPLVKRKNKKGQEFIGCSNFPKCRYIEGNEKNEVETPTEEERICPECGAKLVLRKQRKGNKYFYGCSNFPKCKHIENIDKKD